MHSRIIAKDDSIQELHEKCEELIQSQIVQIPIFANNVKGITKKKKGNALNKATRSKSQNRGNKLQFVREIADDMEFQEFFMDDDNLIEHDQPIRGSFAPSEHPKRKQDK